MVILMTDLTFHPIADLFPLMQGTDFDDLVEDIREHGLLEPIWLYEGKILDGRNRWRACQVAGVEPVTRLYEGGDPVGFAVSLNLCRRHLNESQRAMVGANIANINRGDVGKNHKKSDGQICLSESATKLNVSERSIKTARQVYNKGTPELIKTVEQGELAVSAAAKLAKRHPEHQNAVLDKLSTGQAKDVLQAERQMKEEQRQVTRNENRLKVEEVVSPEEWVGKHCFSTIVIDPPWDWGDEGDVNQFGRAKPDYHTMPIDQIKALPVADLAHDNCHLYLWITNRSLPKGFELLDAWGFRYITCITWIKPSFGLGHYFRGQSEQVLFGVKGSQGLRRKDQANVFHAHRGSGHSGKPEKFYAIVEACSPGPMLEMFSRSDRHGWVHWGENDGQCLSI